MKAKITKKHSAPFRKAVSDYYKTSGRSMPWRPPTLALRKDGTLDPYNVFVSEVMLQQTQVLRVIPKYQAFVKAFPDWNTLAKASLPKLLSLWQGLGYNRRALMLRKTAIEVVEKYNGLLPTDLEAIDALPGIGTATAAAIYVYAWNKPAVFIETNIRTVFIHHFFPNRRKVSDEELLPLIEATLPADDNELSPREWYYALMDYGSMLKATVGNLSRKSKHYARQSVFKGSKRELRGKMLRLLGREAAVHEAHLPSLLLDSDDRVKEVLGDLLREGFIMKKEGLVSIAYE